MSPWIDSSAAIAEKAAPISTDRPSPRRAPASVSASAAAAASPALIAIGRKWTAPGILTSVSPKKCTTAAGKTAQPASKPRRTRSLTEQMGHDCGIGHVEWLLKAPCAPWRSTSKPKACSRGPSDRRGGLELLQTPGGGGFGVEELREAAAQDRLALLPVERVLAGEGKLYAREELAEDTGLDPDFLDQAARALGVPIREPGERAITEEEVELSRNAKALIDAGLNPESFLELTAVMSRSMQNIAASLT